MYLQLALGVPPHGIGTLTTSLSNPQTLASPECREVLELRYLQLDGSSGRERSSILQNYKSSDFKNIIWFLNSSSFYLVIVLKSSHWTSPTREKAQYVTLGSSASDLQQLGNHRSLLVRT